MQGYDSFSPLDPMFAYDPTYQGLNKSPYDPVWMDHGNTVDPTQNVLGAGTVGAMVGGPTMPPTPAGGDDVGMPASDPYRFTGWPALPANATVGQRAAGGPLTAGFDEQAPNRPQFDYAAALNDPGYLSARDTALQSVYGNAAGRGLLGSTGTADLAMSRATDLANQQIGNVFGRQQQEYQNAWQQYLNDQALWQSTQDRNFQKYFDYAQV